MLDRVVIFYIIKESDDGTKENKDHDHNLDIKVLAEELITWV